jgi:hypothetical protein
VSKIVQRIMNGKVKDTSGSAEWSSRNIGGRLNPALHSFQKNMRCKVVPEVVNIDHQTFQILQLIDLLGR